MENYISTIALVLRTKDLFTTLGYEEVIPSTRPNFASYVPKDLVALYLEEIGTLFAMGKSIPREYSSELKFLRASLAERFSNYRHLNDEIHVVHSDVVGLALRSFTETSSSEFKQRIMAVLPSFGNLALSQLDFFLYDEDYTHSVKAVRALEEILTVLETHEENRMELKDQASTLLDQCLGLALTAELKTKRFQRA